jgi:nucleotide-binding universal stress UspA family protein
MSDYPYLSLNHISIDPALARQLPRRLAFYYLALPLARDDDQLTLVMANPDNRAAIAVIEAALGGRVVPVQGSGDEIKAALRLIWAGEMDPAASRILCWGATLEGAALAMSAANVVAQALSAQTICLDASQSSLDTALSVAREGQYSLTVIDAPQGEPLARALRQSSTPVLLARGAYFALRHILLVLRGHSPDDSVLDWVIPLAQAGQAQVTLLTVAPIAERGARRSLVPHGLASLLSPDSEPGQHVMACARRLTEAGIAGQLKLRQGQSEREIADEAQQGGYDLIMIAAEAHGDFAQRVVHAIDELAAANPPPVLVVKPITN